MWAKIITIKIIKDLNFFSLCALHLFNTQISQFELNYWNKGTFPRHSNLLRCTSSLWIQKCFQTVYSLHPKLSQCCSSLGLLNLKMLAWLRIGRLLRKSLAEVTLADFTTNATRPRAEMWWCLRLIGADWYGEREREWITTPLTPVCWKLSGSTGLVWVVLFCLLACLFMYLGLFWTSALIIVNFIFITASQGPWNNVLSWTLWT